MSQAKSPEKKKPRKSLSLSKHQNSSAQKVSQSSSKLSGSPSILSLFKNAPPAKLSCPLCSEMVPRFSLNKHIDEECTKAEQDNDDVILVDDGKSTQQSSSTMTQQPKQVKTQSATTDSKMDQYSKNTEEAKQGSPYFKKNSCVVDIPGPVKVVKTVPLGSLSSKLSRRYQTRRAQQEQSKESNHCLVAVSDDLPNRNSLGEEPASCKSNCQADLGEDAHGAAKVASPLKLDNANDDLGILSDSKSSLVIVDGPHLSPCNDESEISKPDRIAEPVKRKLARRLSLKSSDGKKSKHSPLYESALGLSAVTENGGDRLLVSSIEDSSSLLPMEDPVISDDLLKPDDADGQEETNISSLDSSVEDRQPYYLRNFLMVLQTVMESEEDLSLFNEEDTQTLTRFIRLSAGGQKLYVRLFQRKLTWIKVNKIEYSEIGSDLTFYIEELKLQEFLQSDCELKDLSEALDLLSAPELKNLAKAFHLKNPNAPKHQLVEEFLKLSRQRSIFSKGKNLSGLAPTILKKYESAMHRLVDIVVTMTSGHWKEARALYQACKEEWDLLKDDSTLRYHADLPLFLRCFTVGWVYTRILSRGVEILQRLHLYEQAVELLQTLLSQSVYCPDNRGRWWDRLVLNLHQHLKQTQKAASLILEGLSDPYVRTGHQLSLYQRAVRMRDSPSCKKFHKMFTRLPEIIVEDVPHVTIKGKMYPQTGIAKSVFLMENITQEESDEFTLSTVMCSVEELALAYYRESGYEQGIHGEGSTFSTLYGLLMWDIIFMDGVSDVFRNSYQAFPLDLYTDIFYENRKEAIESRLQLLQEASTETLHSLMANVWNEHLGETSAMVSWERFSSLQQAQSLVSCLGGLSLSGICRKMSKDLRHCRAGLPDLVVWNAHKKIYKLVEVKGPNDRLSHKQMVWLHELKKLGADTEVCHVVAIGAKSNRLA